MINVINEIEEGKFTILNVDDDCSDKNGCTLPVAMSKSLTDNLQEVGMEIILWAAYQQTLVKW